MDDTIIDIGIEIKIPIIPIKILTISKYPSYLNTVVNLISFGRDTMKIGNIAAMFVSNMILIMVPVISSATLRTEAISSFRLMFSVRLTISVPAAVTVTETSIMAPRLPIII